MDTKKLRQKILDLAIHGKLVPQDPNDEPASVLLERIKAEKERLIKEGKIKRCKKSSKTSDTPHYPYLLPNGWEWCKFQDCMDVRDGTHDTPKYIEHGYPLITSKDFKNGKFDFSKTKYISSTDYQNIIKRSKVEVGDILYSMIGGNIGSMIQIRQENYFDMAIKNVALFKPYPKQSISTEYIAFFLESKIREYQSIAIGGAQPFVGLDVFRNTLVPLPPLAEQKRIVAEIERCFALIDQIEQSQSDLQTVIKQTQSKILDLAIHGKLVPQDLNDEPAIELLKRINPDFTPCDNGHSRKLPQGWYSVTVNEVCSIIGGVSYNKADIQDTGIRVLRGGNIQGGKVIDCFDDVFIPLSYQNNDNQVQHGDIIVVASTGSQTLIGKTGFADRDIPKTQIGAFLRIVRPKQKTLSPYIRLLFQTDAYKDYIRNVAKGSNINNVKNAHLQNYQICLPPLAEQQRIVAKIEELFSVLDNIQNALEA